MNSDDISKNHAVQEHAVSESGESGLHEYDAEGLAIKEEGAKEGKIFPGPDAVYPLRESSEDPKWAVRIVAIWIGIASFSIVFILTLMILGIWYD